MDGGLGDCQKDGRHILRAMIRVYVILRKVKQVVGNNIVLDTPAHIKHAIGYFPATLLPALLGVAMSAIFTRVFSPNRYGVLTLVSVTVGPLVTIIAQPAAQSMGRFLAEFQQSEDKVIVYQKIGTILLDGSILAGISVSILGLVAMVTYGVPDHIRLSVVIGAIASINIQIIMSVLRPILSASFQISIYRQIMLGSAIVSFVVSVVAVFLLGRHISVLVWAPVIGQAVFLPKILQHTKIRLIPSLHDSDRSVKDGIRRFLMFGIPVGFWSLSSSLLTNGDKYVIQIIQGTSALAVYGVSYTLASQSVALVSGPYILGSWPTIMKLWATGDAKSVRRSIKKMTDTYFLVGIGIVGGIAVIGKSILHILAGHAYQSGYPILVPIAAGGVVSGVSVFGHKSMELSDRNGLMLMDILFSSAVNFGLNLVVVKRWGFVGASYVTLLSYVLYAGLVWWQSKKILPWEMSWDKIIFYVATSFILWSGIKFLLSGLGNVAYVFIGGGMYFILYVSTGWLYGKYFLR